MKRNKWKKLLGICFVIGALVFSFWYGGNAPGLQGFSLGESAEVMTEKPTEELTEEQVDTAAENESSDSNASAGDADSINSKNPGKIEVRTGSDKDSYKSKKTESAGLFQKIFMQVKKIGSSNKNKSLQTNKKANRNANKNVDKNASKSQSSNIKKSAGNKTDKSTHKQSSKNTEKNKISISSTDKDKGDDSDEESSSKTESTTEENVQTITCTISISCESVLGSLDKLTEAKKQIIPTNGVMLDTVSVNVKSGSTVFEVLKKATKENNVQLEYNYTPAYKTYYIEGIGNLYEFDAGDLSGWMYSVNGTFPGVGCSGYKVSDGDAINWYYTCNFGKDVGD